MLLAYISKLIKKSKTLWDDMLLSHKLLDRLANYAPALVIYYMIPAALGVSRYSYLHPVAAISIMMIILGVLVFDSLLNILHEIYKTFPVSRDVSIRGYIQVGKIMVYFVGIILIFLLSLMNHPLYSLPVWVPWQPY
jgi:miniconductance mechanosensitive channel